MDQYRIPCVIMRAGTSKGIFLKESSVQFAGYCICPACRRKIGAL